MSAELQKHVADALEKRRRDLIAKPLARIWPDLARAAIQAVQEAQDWTVDTSVLAGRILSYLGIGSDCSLDPGADRRRDKIAAMITAWSEARTVRERLLWCVHVTGPDDIIAMPTYEACIALCDKINGYVERIRAAHLDDPNWPITRAYPAPYPWSDEQYAAALRAGSPEYGVEPLPSFPKEGDNG